MSSKLNMMPMGFILWCFFTAMYKKRPTRIRRAAKTLAKNEL